MGVLHASVGACDCAEIRLKEVVVVVVVAAVVVVVVVVIRIFEVEGSKGS